MEGDKTEFLFRIKIRGLKNGVEDYAVESILCDESAVRKADGRAGFDRKKEDGGVSLSGEFRLVLPTFTQILEYTQNVRALVYKAAERYVDVRVEVYAISGGVIYQGSELEFAKMKNDGLLDTDLDDMEEFDG